MYLFENSLLCLKIKIVKNHLLTNIIERNIILLDYNLVFCMECFLKFHDDINFKIIGNCNS